MQEVTKLAERLPAEQTERVLEDANSLVKEAASPEPRKGVVKAFADQILATAQSVAEVAGPIATVVGTILSLL